MQQSCTYGSVPGALGNWRPYRNKRGQTALSTAIAERGANGLQAGTEWSVPFFSTPLGRLLDAIAAAL
jgi:hypothetical protein